MAIVRTAKGTDQNKDVTKDLLIADVSVVGPTAVIVGATWLTAGGKATPYFGERDFGDPIVTVSANGLRTSLWRIFTGKTVTRDIKVEWHDGSRPTAKAAYVSVFSDSGRLDKTASNTFLSTTDPGTGALVTTLNVPEFFMGAMGSKGPSTDTAGTPALSYILGQRVGTTGGVDDSNVTIQEMYKIVTGTEDTRARLTSTSPARSWSVVLGTFSEFIPKQIVINGCISCPWYDQQPPQNPQPLCIEPSVIATSSSPGDRIVPTRDYLLNFPTFCPLEDQP